MTRDEVFDRLIMVKNAEKVVIEFSGGGDEGSIDSIEIRDADDNVIETLSDCNPQSDEDKELVEKLIEPVYDRYGGFDGEPYVQGKAVWDCRTKMITISGSEEYTESHPFSVEF